MVKFTNQELDQAVKRSTNIRNISMSGNVDAGKSTLSDSLLSMAGIISSNDAGKKLSMDTRPDEQERGITIKSCAVSLAYSISERNLQLVKEKQEVDGDEFLINLIDTPGHVDFSSEVTASLRVSDGAICIVDAIDGVTVQTETVLRQMIQENIIPAMIINKVDRAIVELKLNEEELYMRLTNIIVDMNARLASYVGAEEYEKLEFCPIKGNVIFGSGYRGWAFGLKDFAQILADKNKQDPKKIQERLWGEYYIDTLTGKWSKKRDESNSNQVRSFCQVCLSPIYAIHQAYLDPQKFDREKTLKLVEKMGIKLGTDKRGNKESEYTENEFIEAVLRKWLPAGNALLDMIVIHLPSPKTAQKYRVKELYTGEPESPECLGIENCDPDGPLMIFITKMFPMSASTFYAFGRVFSGTARAGEKMIVMGAGYDPENPSDKKEYFTDVTSQSIVMMMLNKAQQMDEIPAGNVIGLKGVDKYLVKSGTLTNSPTAYPILPLKFSVSPIVQQAVEPKDPSSLPKLLKALQTLARSDPLIQITLPQKGKDGKANQTQITIAGAGELHMEVMLQDLQEIVGEGVPLIISDPIVPYYETLQTPSKRVVKSTCPENLNHFYWKVEPLDEELVKAIEEGKVPIEGRNSEEQKKRYRVLRDEYSFQCEDEKKIWTMSPYGNHTNILVDETKSIDYLHDVKQSIIDAFEAHVQEGILTGYPIKGVRVNLVHAKLHSDHTHRKPGSIAEAVRKGLYAGMLEAEFRLMEPVWQAEIQIPYEVVGTIYSIFGQKRGHIFEERPVPNTPRTSLVGYLPVAESFGFANHIRGKTGGKAFPTLVFSHWDKLKDDPREDGSMSNQIVMAVRKRKGLPPTLPTSDTYCAKMSNEDSKFFS